MQYKEFYAAVKELSLKEDLDNVTPSYLVSALNV